MWGWFEYQRQLMILVSTAILNCRHYVRDYYACAVYGEI